MRPRIRSSVGIVINEYGTTEFFKGNTRRSIIYKLKPSVAKLLCTLDGTKTVVEICKDNDISEQAIPQFTKLLLSLKKDCIIYDADERVENADRSTYSRVFSMLEDYSCDENIIQGAWKRIRNSTVCIIGLGAVGSWIAGMLVQSGVRNLILMDNDVVEISNLHRQWGYSEEDIGKRKVDALAERLMDLDHSVNIRKINAFLDEGILDNLSLSTCDLVIDCADKPTVDQTALWIGEYCMKNNIPHIIAGGYNLHVSLIGQTIIPHKTACVKCFEKQLKMNNELELARMKKMNIPGRKIGSLGPMCSLSASFSALEAIKVLSGLIHPTNTDRRGEFNIYNMDIVSHEYKKLSDCEWCGINGKYRE